MPLINCEVSLTLTWSEKSVLTSRTYREKVATQGNNPRVEELIIQQVQHLK